MSCQNCIHALCSAVELVLETNIMVYNGLFSFNLNECLDHEDRQMDVLSLEFRIGRRRVHTALERIL